MNPDLKPCPFCGSSNVIAGDFFARCEDCRTETAVGPLQRPVQVQAWNRRTKGQLKDACPFCGSGKHIHLSTSKADEGRFWLYCQECFAQGPEGATEDEAIRLWDKRAGAAQDEPAP